MLTRARQAVLTRGRDGVSRYKLQWSDYVACVFDFHYLSITKINLFRTSAIYTASEFQCFWFGVKIFNPSAPCWGPE